MPRSFIAAPLLAAALAVACSAPDTTVGIATVTEPFLARPVPSTSIAMTILDTNALGASYQITSDGRGEYQNGVDGMQVEIDQYGNLQITPLNGTSTTPALRQVTFDFSSPVDPANTYRPSPTGQLNFKFVSNKAATGAPGIDQLGVGTNPSSACYALTVAQRTASTHHRDVFNVAADPSSTYALITRTALTPAQWTVSSGGVTCAGSPDQAALYSQDLTKKNAPLVFRGLFRQRFSLVLRAL